MNLDDVLARAQKLLNMTVENGCTPAEAERAAMHASKLLDEYQLSKLDIERACYAEEIGEEEDRCIIGDYCQHFACSAARRVSKGFSERLSRDVAGNGRARPRRVTRTAAPAQTKE